MGAWLRPIPQYHPPAPPTYTSQQIADAKAKVCAAYGMVSRAIAATSSRDKGSDYTTQLASAVNARQALLAGSSYLSTTLENEPATPPDLVREVHKLSNAYQQLAIKLLGDSPEADINSSVHSGDEATTTVEGLCK
ncbi:hypothetical protein Mkiyose1665_39700 [Mycobacterium kiyosense]|nr:hypothetical protein IWGMT90018_27080 [Mycobacterium kiyosense]BDE14466.1 hypothetical protein MKCMC460_33260 [Mycobacterium sp. 20KCMC460]GLB91151.1 hypothetical protein SRL2020130_39680 [Mycobacterium kiyosense]GLC02168.1 hypothetical protein SRL2020400_27590 [Mycobacterium kiyosense]GLC10575.1 hypothetical protein SRL2020411_52210 [Mycobacterium kiyosense]